MRDDKKKEEDENMLENAVLNPAAESLKQSLSEMQQIRNGEMKAESWGDFLTELDAENDL